MDKYLKPDRLDLDPTRPDNSDAWKHWKRSLDIFIEAINSTRNTVLTGQDKLNLLTSLVAPAVFKHFSDARTYDSAIEVLDGVFLPPRNTVFSRHLLATRRQQPGENVALYLQELKRLAKDCDFQPVTAVVHCDEYIRDSFINGLSSSVIRQRLLESRDLDLHRAFEQARTLELSQRQSETYNIVSPTVSSCTTDMTPPTGASSPSRTGDSAEERITNEEPPTIAALPQRECYFCARGRHNRSRCPARNSTCSSCKKKGHYARACRSTATVAALEYGKPMLVSSATFESLPRSSLSSTIIVSSAAFESLSRSSLNGTVLGQQVRVLIDTGSSVNFIHPDAAQRLHLKVSPSSDRVLMASSSLFSTTLGHTIVSLDLNGRDYLNVKLSILPNLCSDIILGHSFLQRHSSVQIPFGGPLPPLSVCGLTAIKNVPYPSLFENLTPDCRPIAVKSRRYSAPDVKFIRTEITRMLKEGIIEPSQSPWRAQTLVVTPDNHKKRLVVDYSQTINRYTLLDAYPLPRIDDMVNEIATYKIFSTVDLASAYHQVAIRPQERAYTAFEADGSLFQFCRIPFGVTNGVASFQRIIDYIIREENLQGIFAYIDNVTICGQNQAEHDANLKKFKDCVAQYGLTLNESKCQYSLTSLNLLGYSIKKGTVRPDPERLKGLIEMPIPRDITSLRRAMGLFSHYSKWIPNFSEKVHPLTRVSEYPLKKAQTDAFNNLKEEITKSSLVSVDPSVPLEVETDASGHAIAASLSQNGRPVAFFSRTLTPSEQRHSSIEKEAYAIVESIRRWRHLLLGRHFKLITDQKSVSFMFNLKLKSKIKNEKIARWRLELACFSYDIAYRPGKQNTTADTLSRVCSSTMLEDKLQSLHRDLCHPGITRMLHFVRTKNLPYSVEDVKAVARSCQVCAEVKPRYIKTAPQTLIKASQPFERLSVDFKGPLPSNSRNCYLLTIVDEYSRFPFAFPCTDVSAATVKKHFINLFSIFGNPSFIHSDRGTAFMSEELKIFLLSRNISTSRTTAFNAQGNGQVERYNGIIWQTVNLALRSNNLPINNWEKVLNVALHSIRSLLSTATNCTPHERLFKFQRRSTTGDSIPSWLTRTKSALLKRHARGSKYEPLVETVDILEVNPSYAHVRFQNGRETTVSLRHIAPLSDVPALSPLRGVSGDGTEITTHKEQEASSFTPMVPEETTTEIDSNTENLSFDSSRTDNSLDSSTDNSAPRRSTRIRRPPPYLTDNYEF